MQIIPQTAVYFGIDTLNATAEQSINAGTKYLDKINMYWEKHIPEKDERIKFVLASYNVGLGHVIDARNLAIKFEQAGGNWDAVSFYLLSKSKSIYYNDPVVKHGYCRGAEPCTYVKEIINRYEHYKNFIPNTLPEQVVKK